MRCFYLLICALVIAGCQPDNGGGVGTTPVSTPLPPTLNQSCLNGSTYCNNSLYNQTPGFMQYPGLYNYAYNYTTHFNQYGFCDCPYGFLPVYNSTYGLGCVSRQVLQPYASNFMRWQWDTATVGWGYANNYNNTYDAPQTSLPNFPQYSNIPQAGHYPGSCTKHVTQSCMMDQSITCGQGAICRQVYQGSNLGVCSSQ